MAPKWSKTSSQISSRENAPFGGGGGLRSKASKCIILFSLDFTPCSMQMVQGFFEAILLVLGRVGTR